MMKHELKRRVTEGEDSLEVTAIHEAGHAVMGYILGHAFEYVTVRPNGRSLGHIRWKFDSEFEREYNFFVMRFTNGFFPFGFGNRYDALIHPAVRSYVEDRMLLAAAGEAAVSVLTEPEGSGFYWSGGGLADIFEFNELAQRITGSTEEAEAFGEWMTERALNLMCVPAHQHAVQKLAKVLKTRHTLTYSKACNIIKKSFENDREVVLKDSIKRTVEGFIGGGK
jgi:hypothetical protein